ncbi:hypothetical protein [Kluyvera intermedia]|uniref:hypothetical protein n=1 Tax=Kluyvera intermedia TaxID=61648 RepID=UPI003524E388
MTKKGEATLHFLKHRETISSRLQELYFIKNAYNSIQSEGIFPYSYEQFRTLCNKFILNKEKKHPHQQHSPQKNTKQSHLSESSQHPSGDIFRNKPKVIHNPNMTEERKKELF